MKKFTFILSVLVLIMSMVSEGYAQRTTRDLVFEDEEVVTESTDSTAGTEPQEIVAGVKTTVLLTRNGQVSTVVPSHEFMSGDSIKLVYTPSIDGYVYWMAKGSTGKISVLFPSEKTGMDNSVKRNQEYTMPIKGSFRFDDNAGQEELLCILSVNKIAEIEEAIGAKGQMNEDGNTYVADIEQNKEEGRQTRDLVFEDEDEGDVNTQQQPVSVEEPFVGHYVLVHK